MQFHKGYNINFLSFYFQTSKHWNSSAGKIHIRSWKRDKSANYNWKLTLNPGQDYGKSSISNIWFSVNFHTYLSNKIRLNAQANNRISKWKKTAKEPPWFCDRDFVQSFTDLKMFFKLNENVIYLLIPLGIIDIYCLKNFNCLLLWSP